jgi:hypothetical protein
MLSLCRRRTRRERRAKQGRDSSGRINSLKEPVVKQKSSNPDFPILTKGIYKHIQLAKAQRNWTTNVPKTISKEVDSTFSFMRPMKLHHFPIISRNKASG